MRNPMVTLVLGLVIGLAVAAGTYFLGVNSGQAQAQDQQNAFFAARGVNPNAAGGSGGAGAGGAGGAGGAARGAGGFGGGTTGTVTKVDANTITINSTRDGDITVTLGPTTSILKTVVGTAADITAGQRLVVRGPQSGKNVAATQIQVGDANAFPVGGGGRAARTPSPTP